MLSDILRAAEQLGDPRIRAVLFKTILATILVFALLWAAVGYLLASYAGPVGWLHWVILVFGHFATAVVVLLLFPGVSALVMTFFLEEVARAVEARYYPGLTRPSGQPLRQIFLAGLRFAVLSIVLNLLALPVYIFIPGINLLFFYGLNGYLMGRGYFELVAFRRVAPKEARRLRLAHPARMLLLGVVITFLLTVPLVNFIAPVFATALMVHVFQGYVDPSTASRWA
jgi:CysZ protein